MPGAPACRHVSTARVTLGSSPPRELRSVATLLTLTDRRIMNWSPDRPPDRHASFFRPRLHGRLILALDHDAEQRLGARVAHEQPASAVERGLDARDRGRDLRHV